MLDHRTLVDLVRGWLEFRLIEGNYRDLERETGVSKSSLSKYAAGDAVPAKNWTKLRMWYLEDQQARRRSLHDPQSMALLVLATLEYIPMQRRREAILQTAGHFQHLHEEANAPLPEWIGVLRAWAEAGAGIPERPPAPVSRKKPGRPRRPRRPGQEPPRSPAT